MAHRCFVADMSAAMEAAEHLAGTTVGQTLPFYIRATSEAARSCSWASDRACGTSVAEFYLNRNNWSTVIGEYRTATVARVQQQGGDGFSMTVSYKLRDIFDFDHPWGASFDPMFHQLHRWGLAREYLNKGHVRVDITWRRGQRL